MKRILSVCVLVAVCAMSTAALADAAPKSKARVAKSSAHRMVLAANDCDPSQCDPSNCPLPCTPEELAACEARCPQPCTEAEVAAMSAGQCPLPCASAKAAKFTAASVKPAVSNRAKARPVSSPAACSTPCAARGAASAVVASVTSK